MTYHESSKFWPSQHPHDYVINIWATCIYSHPHAHFWHFSHTPWHSPPCSLAPACSSDQLACLGFPPLPTSCLPGIPTHTILGLWWQLRLLGLQLQSDAVMWHHSLQHKIQSQFYRRPRATCKDFGDFPIFPSQTYLELTYPTRIDILDVFDIALGSLFRFIQLLMKSKKGHK